MEIVDGTLSENNGHARQVHRQCSGVKRSLLKKAIIF